MSRIAFLLVVLVLVATPRVASAQQPQGEPPAGLHIEAHGARQPVEVASGMDLVAWQSLEHLRLQGTSAVQAYRTFVLDYDASPLAVAAWSRLVELGANLVEDRDEKVARTLQAVRDRWQSLQDTIAAKPVDDTVVTIDLTDGFDDDGAAALRDTGTN